MCFYTQLNSDAHTAQTQFKAIMSPNIDWPSCLGLQNGFAKPYTPIISDQNSGLIELAQWGLIPQWADAGQFKAITLNARIESLETKPSFALYINKRCMILADGFFEWKWIDAQGRRKEKYYIHLQTGNMIAFAGIYSEIINPNTGISNKTYSIVTTAANELMSEIHNSKKRMPIILKPDQEDSWINGKNISDFFHGNIDLKAQRIEM